MGEGKKRKLFDQPAPAGNSTLFGRPAPPLQQCLAVGSAPAQGAAQGSEDPGVFEGGIPEETAQAAEVPRASWQALEPRPDEGAAVPSVTAAVAEAADPLVPPAASFGAMFSAGFSMLAAKARPERSPPSQGKTGQTL
eukprot:845784-Pyramimonas_sp.AAC.1